MQSVSVVVVPPVVDNPAGMAIAGEQVLIEALVAQPANEGLDEPVLYGASRGDVVPVDLGILLPLQDGVRGQLSAVIGDNDVRVSRLTAEPIQLPRHANTGGLVVHHSDQALAVEVVHHAENVGASARLVASASLIALSTLASRQRANWRQTLFRSIGHAREILEAWRSDSSLGRSHSSLSWLTPC